MMAEIVDVNRPVADPLDAERSETDPVTQLVRLRREELRHRAKAEDAVLEQVLLLRQHRDNPQLQSWLGSLNTRLSRGEAADREPLPVMEFFASGQEKTQPAAEPVSSLADRSKWSPKLRKLIEEKFPEATREERIRRATERPRSVILGEGLSLEEVRYFAEDVDLEYDV